MTGNTCQECGRPRAADGGTGAVCGCEGAAGGGGRGAGPQARPGRGRSTAEEIAAAEDFDPLRIRPYVTLEALDTSDGPADGGRAASGTPGPAGHLPGADAHGAHPPVTAGPDGHGGGPAGPYAGAAHGPYAHGAAPGPRGPGAHGPLPHGTGGEGDHPTAVLRPVAAPLPAEVPAPADATQELPPLTAGPAAQGAAPAPRRSRRRGAVALAAAAAFAVAGTAAYASGLFDGGEDRDRVSMPDRGNGPSLVVGPDAPLDPPSPTASPSASASRTAKPSPSASASSSPTASASASASRSAPASSAPAQPPAPTPTAQVTGTVSEEPPGGSQGTLRLGDTGSDVRELQLRLQEIWLYPRDWQTNGVFDTNLENSVKVFQWDRGIKGDPLGVYGPQTRRALEEETREPRRR